MAKLSVLQALAAGARGVSSGLKQKDEQERLDREEARTEQDAKERTQARELDREIRTTQLQRDLEGDVRREGLDRETSALRRAEEKRRVSAEGRAKAGERRKATEFTVKLDDVRRMRSLNDIQDQGIRDQATLFSLNLQTKEQGIETKRTGRAFNLADQGNVKEAIKLMQPSYEQEIVGIETPDGNMIIRFGDGSTRGIQKTAIMRSLGVTGIVRATDVDILRENRAGITSLVGQNKALREEAEALGLAIKQAGRKERPALEESLAGIGRQIKQNMGMVTSKQTANANLTRRPVQPRVATSQTRTEAEQGQSIRAVTERTANDPVSTTPQRQPLSTLPAEPPPPVTTPTLRLPIGDGAVVPAVPTTEGPGGTSIPEPGGVAARVEPTGQRTDPITLQQAEQAGIPFRDFQDIDINRDGKISPNEWNSVLTLAEQTLESPNATAQHKAEARATISRINGLIKQNVETAIPGGA